MRKTTLLFSFFVIPFFAFSQLENRTFKDPFEIIPADSQKLFLTIRNLNFLKNDEYFGEIADGYTLYGYQLHPNLVYFPFPQMRVEAGIFLMKEFGRDGYTQALPTFTVKFEKHGFASVFGNIEGGMNHRLIEPLYDFERVMIQRLEFGGQILVNKKNFWADGWMNWEKAQHKGDPFKEEFTVGLSMLPTFARSKNQKFSFQIPTQIMISHRGGQLDTDTTPLVTLLDVAGGISLEYSFQKNFFKSIRLENYYVYYKDLSFTKLAPFIEGDALYLNFFLKTKFANLLLSYWNGNGFYAPRGGALYQAVSTKDGFTTEENRNLAFLRLMHENEIFENVFLEIRFEPYYDFNNDLLEYSYGIYLAYRGDFFLKKFKKI